MTKSSLADFVNTIENQAIIKQLQSYNELFWQNPDYGKPYKLSFDYCDVQAAVNRFKRFAPYLANVFKDTDNGIIESPLTPIPKMQNALLNKTTNSQLFLKEDNKMPISGSVKSRGGIYEVLKFAEQLAIEHLDFNRTADYLAFNSPKFKKFFSQYTIEVASTGNLGLSVGLMASTLGFKAIIHMSQDAVKWKVEKLRANGAEVIIYNDNFSNAITAARHSSMHNPFSYFVDDEASADLFLGYSVAGPRLLAQLKEQNITIDSQHPLFVYLPAGVGGSPAGIAFGLKTCFGEHVYPVFVEPTHIPSVLLGMATKLNHDISVYDIGIDGKTRADGLAVGRPSVIAGNIMRGLLSGIATCDDDNMFKFLKLLKDTENIAIEPSSTVGFKGYLNIMNNPEFTLLAQNATHVVWSTGGAMVPLAEQDNYYKYSSQIKA